MGQIANWGETIKFEVSSSKVLTFNDFKRTVSGRWKKHDIVGKKPRGEFAGPEAAGITMAVTISAEHGVKPLATLDKLEKAAEKGTVDFLFVGGQKIGSNKLCLESVSETWDKIWGAGELVSAKVNLTFTEYAEDAKPAAGTPVKPSKPSKPTKKPTKPSKKPTKTKTYKVGDIVNFKGGKHYVSSWPGAKGYNARAGKAKITMGPNCAGNGKAHPYHLVHTSGSKSNVYGWVDKNSFS